ncbi:hypothetical protein PGTUg99_004962 [Puccinia graminis f. sp. tritici]|uniref:Uncharacterized protein n=1 Tax=Puccinia graminis f. sp. tritici TaxID=56615 RepID=A0A5B0NHL5_PUCGR|nr:hypothetical protein PGTUg99_027177 [Puccinia graminis f. sp. tritici]KAA1104886.1 hypothetical protein PGTUg99_004962 [Puccinia graminis f. sp. tritici]
MVETPDPNPGDGLDRGLCRAWTPPCRHDITADAFLASRFKLLDNPKADREYLFTRTKCPSPR